MTFSEFLKLMHSYIGCGVTQQDYVLYITNLIIREPSSESEEAADEADNYNPMSGKSPNLLSKIYNGESNRKIAVNDARRLLSLFSKTKFVDEFISVDMEARENLVGALKKHEITSTADTVDEVCAEIFYRLIEAMATGRNYISSSDIPHVDRYGQRLAEAPLTSVYVEDGVIHIADEKIELPIQLTPEEEFAPYELPYINALCDAYADALSMIITPDDIDKLPNRYHKDFVSQREAYFAAESLQRSVREVYSDGEDQFNNLKKEAYDGVENTYLQDYENGYKRLQAVIDKMLTMPLSASTLARTTNLIRNMVRKGICHVLVNDGRIKSWVNTDE